MVILKSQAVWDSPFLQTSPQISAQFIADPSEVYEVYEVHFSVNVLLSCIALSPL